MKWLLFLFPVLLFSVPFNDPLRDPLPYFITGDGFRAYADHVFDEVDRSLYGCSVERNQTVFVNADFLVEYFEKIHPFISAPYILITHNSDVEAPGAFRAMLDDPKLVAWCAVHVEGEPHPKLHPIPLGIANRVLPYGNIDAIKKAQQAAKNPKQHLLYFNLTIQNHLEERWPVYQHLNRAPFCYRPLKKRFDQYVMEVAQSQFIVAPRGVGSDTYRLWESLYIGSYPVVRTSALDPLYRLFPVLIVQDWKQITEPFLKQMVGPMAKGTYTMEALDIQYWLRYINSLKK